MSALSTAAILGLTAATAGTQIAGAALQNRAAGKAVDAQTEASNKALALQQQMYQQQQQSTQPYQQLGQTALGRLGAMPQNTAQFNPSNYSQGAPIQQPGQSPFGMSGGQPPTMQPMGGQFPSGSLSGAQPPTGQSFGGGMNEPMVKIQAPDGMVREFPQSQARDILMKQDSQGRRARIL